MEAALLASFLNTFMPKIWDGLKKRSKMQDKVKLQIHSLIRDLPMMAITIEAYESSGMEMDAAQREWIKRVRLLAQDMENHIEMFLYPDADSHTSSKFARKIEDLMEKLKSIKEDQRMLGAPAKTSTSHVDQSIPGLPGAVYAHEPFNELLELVQEPKGEGKLKVIAIVGFGGLGKTLRAKQVYEVFSQQVVSKRFNQQAWICAAAMDGGEILKMIRQILENEASSSAMVKQTKTDAEHIKTCLQEKRYLIVIDDMRKPEQWHRIKSAFPKELNSRIIVTTSNHSVADVCSRSGGYAYKLPPLNRDHSLDLLLNDISLDRSAAEEDAKELLNKCDGLPLALISLSEYLEDNGGLTRKSCEEACRILGDCLAGHQEEMREIRQVLKNKYAGLSGHVRKACLLYFSMSTCNNQTRRNCLIRRWVAEGFGSQDDAITHFQNLINLNVIQATDVSSNGDAKRCQPPRMMVEYIVYKAMSENFVTFFPCESQTNGLETNGYHNSELTYVRRLSLNADSSTGDRWLWRINLPLVRTLEISGKDSKEILNFGKGNYYKLMRVLDLKECAPLTQEDARIQLEHICDHLFLLRYLSLGGNYLCVPRRIANLKLLETLHMTRNRIVIVPFELIQLPSLTHLLGKFQFYPGEYQFCKQIIKGHKKSKARGTLPLYIPSKLQRFSGFVGSEKGCTELMPDTGSLRKVKIWCNSTEDETLSAAIKKFIREGTGKPKGNRSLTVDFTGSSIPFKDSDKYPGSLTSLKLKGRMAMFPEFLELADIEKLSLSSTTLSWSSIEKGMVQFPRLVYLKLYEADLHDFAPEPEHATTDAPNMPAVKSFQRLQRICFSAEGRLPQPAILQHLDCLTQVFLYSAQTQDGETRCSWKEAAKKHPRRPMVWFGSPPRPVATNQ